MTEQLVELFKELTDIIKNTYESSVTMEEAERLAARFLHAQMLVSEALRSTHLDSRMKKNGVKAIRGAVYMENATKTDKKPSDMMLQAMVDRDDIVLGEQQRYDEAEVEKEYLQNNYDIFKDAHIYYRGIAKGLNS